MSKVAQKKSDIIYVCSLRPKPNIAGWSIKFFTTRNRHFELSDQKMFPCQTCGRTFKDPSGLTAHEKIHTGEKKHGCQTCAKSFLTRARLKVHQVRANLYFILS